ncbi:MAG TPA: ROK family protein [Anaerolineae bacterium]
MPTYAVGIDIGATNTKIGLVRADAPDGKTPVLVAHATLSSQLHGPNAEPFIESIAQTVRSLVKEERISRIGVSLCSLINTAHTGAFLSVNAPALNGFDISAAFTSRFGCPVRVLNDVNAYALAEYHHGAGQGAQRMLCIALGTGLAIACINDGHLLETWAGVCADAARIILEPAADVSCKAGVRGSAEALCGTNAIERVGRQRYGANVSARDVIEASRAGDDSKAAATMTDIGNHVGHLLAILSPIFFPQRIVVTGGTSEAGEPLFNAIRSRYAALIGDYMANLALLETGVARPVDIVKGALGPDAAILGSIIQEN